MTDYKLEFLPEDRPGHYIVLMSGEVCGENVPFSYQTDKTLHLFEMREDFFDQLAERIQLAIDSSPELFRKRLGLSEEEAIARDKAEREWLKRVDVIFDDAENFLKMREETMRNRQKSGQNANNPGM